MALQHLWVAMLSRSLRERNANRRVATVGDSASAVSDQLYYLDRLAQAQRCNMSEPDHKGSIRYMRRRQYEHQSS
jgi:hypothetical protein